MNKLFLSLFLDHSRSVTTFFVPIFKSIIGIRRQGIWVVFKNVIVVIIVIIAHHMPFNKDAMLPRFLEYIKTVDISNIKFLKVQHICYFVVIMKLEVAFNLVVIKIHNILTLTGLFKLVLISLKQGITYRNKFII